MFTNNTSFFIATPQLSYKWNRNERSDFLFSAGMSPIFVDFEYFGTATAWFPFLDIIYLISKSKSSEVGGLQLDLIGD